MPKKKSVLIITEKPQAATKIAFALSNGSDEKIVTKDKVSYYEFTRDSKRYVVGCAVGHLFEIQQREARGGFPNFDVEWKPAYEKKASAFTKKYFDTLKRLAKKSDEFVVATDFDVEGEVIGWNVVRFLCGEKDAKRMKFSSLTKEALNESFESMMPHLNWGAAIAGETRHYIDWYYGINLSRGLMRALSAVKAFRILSIGRVQGPALKIVADREREIKKFKPEPFWQIFLVVKDLDGNKVEVKHVKDIFKESELVKFKHLAGKKAIASTEIKEEKVKQPTPFDLTTLQMEAHRHFGLTPAQTLNVAQSLYLAGVISYPRTSSQKYPASIGYDKILKRLQKYTTLVKYATKKKPTEGKKDDPAHPAIYPTGEIKKMTGFEKKVYDLIVKRFIACFADEAVVESRRIKVVANGLDFRTKGTRILEKGWMKVYPSSVKEEDVPIIRGEVDILEIRTEEKKTKPPQRYTSASLVKELEKRGLGTKATRASIVETLYSRGYIKDKTIVVTELGLKLVEALEKYSPIILDEKLTREMTKDLEEIEMSKKKDLKKEEEKILNKAKKVVTKIAKEMLQHLEQIGKALSDAQEEDREQEREENTMSECPVCKKGKLRIMYSRKFRRYFVACTRYPKCKTNYSLPPNGQMKPARDKDGKLEFCQECGFPLVVSFRKGKRPWRFCFNPDCPTNAELKKRKEEFKRKLASGEIEVKNGKIIDHTKKDNAKKTKRVSKKTVKKVSKRKKKSA